MNLTSLISRRAAYLALVLIIAVAAACGGDDSGDSSPESTDTAGVGGATFDTPTGITCSREQPAASGNGKTYDAAPELTIDDAAAYTATLDTTCGEIELALDAANAPITVNNFVFLARDGFYDGLGFHRAVPGFVIQGGDPDGNGTGGPGYSFEDELPTDGYAQGSLAMANAGPSTNGSQFFIVTGDASALQNNFSRFGRVTKGLEVAQGIESLGTPNQTLAQPVFINSVTITED